MVNLRKNQVKISRLKYRGNIMVELREITEVNFMDCISLSVYDTQKEFVATNLYSLAQAWVYYDTAYPFAIYSDNVMVGFIMLGYYELKGVYTVWRFMIDRKFQNKGYGKEALLLAIDFLKNKFNISEVYLAYNQDNYVAEKLYESVGFTQTGEIIDEEIEMRLIIND